MRVTETKERKKRIAKPLSKRRLKELRQKIEQYKKDNYFIV